MMYQTVLYVNIGTSDCTEYFAAFEWETAYYHAIIYGLVRDDLQFILEIDDIQGIVRLRHMLSSGMDPSLTPISEEQFKLYVCSYHSPLLGRIVIRLKWIPCQYWSYSHNVEPYDLHASEPELDPKYVVEECWLPSGDDYDIREGPGALFTKGCKRWSVIRRSYAQCATSHYYSQKKWYVQLS